MPGQLLSQLVLQMHHPVKGWVDCALIDLDQPQRGPKGAVTIRYLDDYVTDDPQIEFLGTPGWPAAWMQVPLELAQNYRFETWPVFFMDIVPTGAAWHYWSGHFDVAGSAREAHFLQNAVIAPIGNLRIKEAIKKVGSEGLPFSLPKSQLASLRIALDPQLAKGVGAGGDAPKVLVRLSQDQQTAWIDDGTYTQSPDAFYLVKLARRSSEAARPSERDRQILSTEFAYYQELNDLGFETLDCSSMFLDESGEEPTLWLPRFDRVWDDEAKQWQLLGVESIAAVIGQRGLLRHEAVLLALKSLYQRDPEAFQDQNFESLVLE